MEEGRVEGEVEEKAEEEEGSSVSEPTGRRGRLSLPDGG